MHRPEFEKVMTATVPSLLMLHEDCVCFMLFLQDLDRQNHGAIAIHLAKTGGFAGLRCDVPRAEQWTSHLVP